MSAVDTFEPVAFGVQTSGLPPDQIPPALAPLLIITSYALDCLAAIKRQTTRTGTKHLRIEKCFKIINILIIVPLSGATKINYVY
jgi:hypothetical protein